MSYKCRSRRQSQVQKSSSFLVLGAIPRFESSSWYDSQELAKEQESIYSSIYLLSSAVRSRNDN